MYLLFNNNVVFLYEAELFRKYYVLTRLFSPKYNITVPICCEELFQLRSSLLPSHWRIFLLYYLGRLRSSTMSFKTYLCCLHFSFGMKCLPLCFLSLWHVLYKSLICCLNSNSDLFQTTHQWTIIMKQLLNLLYF